MTATTPAATATIAAATLDAILDAMNLRDGIGARVTVLDYTPAARDPYTAILFPVHTLTALEIDINGLRTRFLTAAAQVCGDPIAQVVGRNLIPAERATVDGGPALYLNSIARIAA